MTSNQEFLVWMVIFIIPSAILLFTVLYKFQILKIFGRVNLGGGNINMDISTTPFIIVMASCIIIIGLGSGIFAYSQKECPECKECPIIKIPECPEIPKYEPVVVYFNKQKIVDSFNVKQVKDSIKIVFSNSMSDDPYELVNKFK